jgi:hypothetical protein
MNKFVVCRTLGKNYSTNVVETFDNIADATAYANIMRRKNDDYTYGVYQLNEEL